eukprot:TRINITY_DN581_c0_g1_i24.p1 TRINITY_DN581_c0_g1~~TRINITY_DN581_c0_g1_i24.p1  ORF type:complete len:113 (+),score=8.42 TRINITY_DN581_c0_g1_i24:894-1232(+)
MIIKLKDEGVTLIRFKPTRYYPAKRKILNDFVKDLLEKGIIEETRDAEWLSPVVFIQNKNGRNRLCVWFRYINKLLKRNHFPLPNPLMLVHVMGESRKFFKIDLKWSYDGIL